jgi:hypothetical protein
MTLPGPQATRHWQGRVLVDRNGEALGSIEVVYFDKATGQPEWARLETSAARPVATVVPLVGASEEGDTVRVPVAKTLVEQAPSVPAGRELSEDQEEQLYRHYGVPYSRAESPSGLPAGAPMPASGSRPTGVGAPASEAPVPGSELGGRGGVRITDPRVGAAAGVALAVAAGVWRRQWIGRQISPAISRLGAIPTTVSRQRRRRRRAKARNQAMTSARARTRALAWGTGRTLATVAVLSAAGVVQGGRRTWAGVQAAQQAARQGSRRLRPAPRRRRRRGRFTAKTINRAVTRASKQTTALAQTTGGLLAGAARLPVTGAMQGGRRTRAGVQAAQAAIMRRGARPRPRPRRRRRRATFAMVVGGTAGYVLGARAGEQRYQEITQTAKRVGGQTVAKLDQLSGQAADKLQKARQPTISQASGSGNPQITAAPDTPPGPPS